MELRSLKETCKAMVGVDQKLRAHQRRSSREMLTVFGRVELSRTEWRARGVAGGLRPLDAELNLPPDLYSFGLHRKVAWSAANEAYDAVVDTVKESTGLLLGKRQVEQVAIRSAAAFDAFYAPTAAEAVEGSTFMVLTFDGKGIVMRPEALRPTTRNAAERSNHLEHRLSPGEKKGCKRMAEVAAVYELASVPRTTADIIDELEGAPTKRPKAQNKRVWASVEKDPTDVIAAAFAEALGRDPDRQRSWLVLVDGNKDQIRYVRAEARRIGVDVTLIMDVIHVIEYVWKAAWCLHEKADPDAERWVTARLRRLLDGDVSGVAAGIRRSATKRGLTQEERAPMDSCANYLLKHKAMLRYDTYLAAGMPIATGVIEGACRHLIQDRMDVTGARWSLSGAEAVIKLRPLRSSHDFTHYWDFHVERELHRNHLSNYAIHELSHLRTAHEACRQWNHTHWQLVGRCAPSRTRPQPLVEKGNARNAVGRAADLRVGPDKTTPPAEASRSDVFGHQKCHGSKAPRA